MDPGLNGMMTIPTHPLKDNLPGVRSLIAQNYAKMVYKVDLLEEVAGLGTLDLLDFRVALVLLLV